MSCVVLVIGAWHTPKNYQKYTRALEAAGYEVYVPELTTCDGGTFESDVAIVRDQVQILADADRDIILVMHSYGGAVGSCASDGLSITQRREASKPGGIFSLIYLCAYILPEDGTIMGIVERAGYAEKFPEAMVLHTDGTCFPRDPRLLFFGQVAEDEVREGLQHLKAWNGAASLTPMSYAPWKYLPSVYIFTTEDEAVPWTYQKIMTDDVKIAGFDLYYETFDTSHSIFLTKTADMVRVVRQAEMRAKDNHA